jgi:tRNA(Ile)-lysidine synthase
MVQQVALPRGIRISVSKVDALSQARDNHQSLEHAARELRYAALEEMAAESGCKWILTGHTKDDSAETVIMRMRSGAPWYEWTGIPARRGTILRPLLTVQRNDLRVWVAAKRLPFREDETNSDQRFLRNRLRAELSTLSDYWISDQIHRFAAAGEALEATLSIWRRMVYVLPVIISEKLNEGTVGLAIDEIFRYFNNLTFLPVEVVWGRLSGQQEARLPSKLRRQIASFLRGTASNAMLPLPKGISLLRRRNRAWLMSASVASVRMPVSLGTWPVPERNKVLVIADERNPQGKRDHLVRLRSEILQRDLVVRSWQAGDRIKPVKRPTKKISDLLAELKMDPAARERVLVLGDERGPLMILGGAVDERAAADGTQGESIWVTWSEGESIGAGHVI